MATGELAAQFGSGDVRCSGALSTRRDTPPEKARALEEGKKAQAEAESHVSKQAGHTRTGSAAGGANGLGFFLAEAILFLAPHTKQPLAHCLTLLSLAPLLSPHQTPPPVSTKPKPTTASSALQWMGADTKGRKGAVGGGGLELGLERQFAFDREMLLMADGPGAEPQKRRGWRQRPLAADLLQNCDLPPPAKLFGPGPTLQRLESAAGADQKASAGGNNDSLLRALRLSQSRAREAEEKLAAAGASNGDLAALLVRDSVALSAHRRWVMMLEAENSLLRGAAVEPGDEEEEEEAARCGGGLRAWWVALAVCVGLALGRLLC